MDWTLTETVRTAALLISFFLLAVLGSRAVWVSANILLSVVIGVAFFLVPNMLMDFQVVGTLDPLHLHLCRIHGLVLACGAILWYITRDTRDGTVPITLIMSKVFGCSTVLMAQIYTHFGTDKGKKAIHWSEQHIWFAVVAMFLWLLGHVIQLARSDDFSTYPQHNIRLNTHLRLDGWLMMMVAIACIAFPDFLVSHLYSKVPNAVHLHLVRGTGAMFLEGAVVALQAPGFLHERDKRALFKSRLMSLVILFVPLAFSSLVLKALSLRQLAYVALALSPLLGNALIGNFADGTTIYRVEKKTH